MRIFLVNQLVIFLKNRRSDSDAKGSGVADLSLVALEGATASRALYQQEDKR